MDATAIIARSDMSAGGSVMYTNLALSCIFPSIAALTVAGRFYGRRLKRMTPGIDDWIILLAMVLHVAQAAMSILRDVKGGFGVPASQITYQQLKTQNQASYANDVFYPMVLTLARFSITVLVIKIFSVSSLRWAGYANLVFCTAWLIYCVLTGMLRCHPLEKAWHKEPEYPGTCGNELVEIIKNAAWNIVCDLTTLLLPTAGVWRLQLNKAHKWGLTAVFALGFVVIVTAGARIGVSIVADTQQVSASYNAARTNLSFVESSLSIVVACAPTLRPVFTSAFHIYTPSGAQSHPTPGPFSDSRRRPSAMKGFETLDDSYELDDQGRRTRHAPIRGDANSTSATKADGSPVPEDNEWARRWRRGDRNSDHIKVTQEVTITHDV